MATTEQSERKRLYPVIATILKLTSQEKLTVESAMQSFSTEDLNVPAAISSFTNSFSSLFGGSNN